jgi:chitinase
MITELLKSLRKPTSPWASMCSWASLTAMTALATLLIAASAAQAQKKAKIFAYYPDWNKLTGVVNPQLENLTHVIYFSIEPPVDGNVTDDLIIQSVDGQALYDVIDRGHAYGVQVLLCVGGAETNGKNPSKNFPAMTGNATARKKFATTVAAFCRNNGVKGIDIDWEFPPGGGGNLPALMDDLKKEFGSDLLLTMAVNPETMGSYGSAPGKADYVMVMSYDNRPPTTSVATTDMSTAAGKVTDKSKLMLGVPFYGRTGWPGGGELEYRNIVKNNPGLDPTSDNSGGYSFNGTTTLKAKTDVVLNNGYGGMMIWEITHDYKDATTPGGRLLSAMAGEVKSKGATLDKAIVGVAPNHGGTLASRLLRSRAGSLSMTGIPGAAYRLSLLSPSGRLVTTLFASAPGNGQVTWPTAGLSGGRYVYRLSGGLSTGSGLVEIRK